MPSALEWYQGDWGRRYHAEKRGIPEVAVSWVARLRAAKLAPWIGREDVVLEYGVGLGWNLAALECGRRLGYDVADFLEAEVRRLGIQWVPDTQALPEGSVDAVVCHHTLEHVRAPVEALGEIRRLLKPGGRLLLFVPFEKERRYRRYRPAEPNRHLYSWNVQTLGNLVRELGFELERAGLGLFRYDRFAAVWAARMHLGAIGFRWIRRVLLLLAPEWEVRVLALKAFSNLPVDAPRAAAEKEA